MEVKVELLGEEEEEEHLGVPPLLKSLSLCPAK